jgi:hypothetical protein
MKRIVPLFASFVLSTVMIGCGEEAAPPAGKMGEGTETGPSTKGLAKQDREKLLENMGKQQPTKSKK